MPEIIDELVKEERKIHFSCPNKPIILESCSQGKTIHKFQNI